MAFLYLTRTVHMPVTAHGNVIKNNFGVVIATATDSFIAEAMAELINMSHESALLREKGYEDAENLKFGLNMIQSLAMRKKNDGE